MNRIIFILLLFFFEHSFGQLSELKPDQDSLVEYNFMCNMLTVHVKIPAGHINDRFIEYGGRAIIVLTYPDSSCIKFTCGKYSLILSDNENSLNERKEYFKGMTFAYERVPNKRLKYFDSAFDKIAKKRGRAKRPTPLNATKTNSKRTDE